MGCSASTMKPGKLPCILGRTGTAGPAFTGIMTNFVTFEVGDLISWALVLGMCHTAVTTLGWLLNVPDFLAPADGCLPPLLK